MAETSAEFGLTPFETLVEQHMGTIGLVHFVEVKQRIAKLADIGKFCYICHIFYQNICR